MPRPATFVALLILLAPSAAPAQGPARGEPDMALKFFVDPAVKYEAEPTREAHRMLADQLNDARIGVPDDRVAYFKRRRSPAHAAFIGWDAMIVSVEPIRGGGAVVLLSVRPDYDGATTSNEIFERYYVLGERVEYLGYEIPPSAKFPYVETR